MEPDRAAENLEVIRTLMERSALYRRALAPLTLLVGVLGLAAGLAGLKLGIGPGLPFIAYWCGMAVVAIAAALFLVRRQALRDEEPFWSPPTRRVALAMAPPLFAGLVLGVLAAAAPGAAMLAPALPALWMILYGCSLAAAGFFMQRGIKLLGWVFVVCGCAAAVTHGCAEAACPLLAGHASMTFTFGGLHLVYGIYLYFTERPAHQP